MADLKDMFATMGYENISTYIQSGNVFFSASKVPFEVAISNKIKEQFGFEVPVIVISAKMMHEIVAQNPYVNQPIEKLHITFLSDVPDTRLLREVKLLDYAPDQFTITDNCVFLCLESKYHKSKLSNNFFEKKLNLRATTRNWKTALKLLELSK